MMQIKTINVGNELGECILWHEETQCVWWTDITQKKLYSLDWQSDKLTTYETPYKLCSFGFVNNNTEQLIAAFEHRIGLYNPKRNEFNEIYQLTDKHQVRFNDGRVDADGRFWVGTMSEAEPLKEQGILFCVQKQHDEFLVSQHITQIQVSNSICWANDNSTMYLADSGKQQIYTFDYNATQGALSNRQVFADISTNAFGDAAPDGSTVDAQNKLWNAQWGDGSIAIYDANGELVDRISLAAKQPTCVCFGGPDMDLLFVSSAKIGLSEKVLSQWPLSGDVFVFKANSKGLYEHKFKL